MIFHSIMRNLRVLQEQRMYDDDPIGIVSNVCPIPPKKIEESGRACARESARMFRAKAVVQKVLEQSARNGARWRPELPESVKFVAQFEATNSVLV